MAGFRVMQFNMQFGQVWDEADPLRAPIILEETINEIRRQKPDLLFLQELEHAVTPEVPRLRPHFHRLIEAFPAYHSVCAFPDPDPRELPFGIGLAVFSRAPLAEPRRVVLPSPRVEFLFNGRNTTPTDRIALLTRTQLGGRDVALINTHLLALFMIGSSAREHPEQREILATLAREERLPLLLAGDFNSRDHASLVDLFGTAGLRTVQTDTPTWRHRPYVLDHIFHSEQLVCESCSVVPTPASDHHVLLADMAWR